MIVLLAGFLSFLSLPVVSPNEVAKRLGLAMEDQQPAAGGRGTKAAQISNQAVRLLREHTGRGPTKARTTITDDHVMIVMADTLTVGERTLVDSGNEDRVLQVRGDFQTSP